MNAASRQRIRRELVPFGYTSPRPLAAESARLYPGSALGVVEREPRVVELARAWFDLDGIPARARAGTSSSSTPFDASGATEALHQPSSFAATCRALTPRALAVNPIGTLDRNGPAREVAGQLQCPFQRVRVVSVMEAHEAWSSRALRNVPIGPKPRG